MLAPWIKIEHIYSHPRQEQKGCLCVYFSARLSKSHVGLYDVRVIINKAQSPVAHKHIQNKVLRRKIGGPKECITSKPNHGIDLVSG